MRTKDFWTKTIKYDNRRFQLAFFQITHRELIFRSRTNDLYAVCNDNKTIDIILSDVSYLEIPTELKNISFRAPNQADIKHIRERINGKFREDEIIVVCSQDQDYYIVASLITIKESKLDDMQLPVHVWLTGTPE